MTTTLKKFILLIAIISVSFSTAQSIAVYDIELTTIWTMDDHTSVPGSAHWSDLIGATHANANEFMEIGQLASTGIKNVAEFGSNGAITGEINAAITAGDADKLLQDGFSPFAGNDSVAVFSDVNVSEFFPLISLVSMVAPSPDWFIAINSLNLRSGNNSVLNGWKDTFTVDVFAYDAGTDSGTNYGSGDLITNPFQPISMVTGAPINGNKMATITFTYKSSTLSVDDINSIESVKVYPNPATNVLNITNTVSNSLESAELYNILGKRVSMSLARNNDIVVNTNNLQSGVYVLRLNGIDGATSTRKVIIE